MYNNGMNSITRKQSNSNSDDIDSAIRSVQNLEMVSYFKVNLDLIN